MGKMGRRIPLVGLLLVMGCGSVGPATVTRDRIDYNGAVANSWNEQTLLNIVKLRYLDMPVFLEVAQIISGYTLEGTLGAEGVVSSSGAIQGNYLGVVGQGKYTDRPTITYSPLTGVQFMKNLMTPIQPVNVFLLIQSGWPADRILQLTVQSINGLNNSYGGIAAASQGEPQFYRVAQLIRQIQQTGQLGMRVEESSTGRRKTLVFFPKKYVEPKIHAAASELKRVLGLKEDTGTYHLVFGVVPETEDEIAMLTRSMTQILVDLSSYVDVPQIHVAEKRVVPAPADREKMAKGVAPLIQVHSGKERSPWAFVAVKYRDYWFWIDDRDLASKSTFAFVNFLFAFAEAGSKEGVPLVTIPAG